jgi:hypothetical protein
MFVVNAVYQIARYKMRVLIMAKEFNLRQYLKNGVRRLSYRYPARSEAIKLHRIPAPSDWPNKRVKWVCRCAICEKIFELSDMQADHIEPIIPLTGWPEAPKSELYKHNGGPDMNVLVYRCFVDPHDYQILCKPCHKEKSKNENKTRKKD